LQAAQIHFREILGEDVAETALGHAHVQRHLTAFKAMHLVAGTRLGALDAAARGLAQARGGTAAQLVLALVGAGIVLDLVQLHQNSP
jgi:hypothetical protein